MVCWRWLACLAAVGKAFVRGVAVVVVVYGIDFVGKQATATKSNRAMQKSNMAFGWTRQCCQDLGYAV